MGNTDNEPRKGTEGEMLEDEVKTKIDGRRTKRAISLRELRFIKAYTAIGVDTYNMPVRSAIKAGYVEATVEHAAYRLMKKPEILAAIEEVYAARMENTPTNVARIMSNLDNTEALALKSKSMPTLTKVAELRGKYLDIWASNNAAANTEQADKILERMTQEEEDFRAFWARLRTHELSHGMTPEQIEAFRQSKESEARSLFAQIPESVKDEMLN